MDEACADDGGHQAMFKKMGTNDPKQCTLGQEEGQLKLLDSLREPVQLWLVLAHGILKVDQIVLCYAPEYISVRWFDKNAKVIAQRTARVDNHAPGETLPFHVSTSKNPEIMREPFANRDHQLGRRPFKP
jgi:hypothetical protein